MIRRAVILLASCCFGYGASYVVDTANPSASDSNPGSGALPWKTIAKATTTAAAGDTVTIKAGTYNEWVTNQVSGSAGNLITFQGERGGSGEWLTIIDPSTDASSGWVAAPEIGSGVYKKTGLPFETHELTLNNQRVGFVWDMGSAMSGDIGGAYFSSGLTTGAQLMALASNATLTTAFSHQVVNFWDGIEALYGTTNTTTTFLRLRDGSDPNGLNIRIAPNRDAEDTGDLVWPVVKITGKDYITWSNVCVRGAFAGILVNNSANVTLASNYVANGYTRIGLYSGSTSNCLVTGNTLTTDFYGYSDPGAWENTGNVIRENVYLLVKFLMGNGLQFDNSIKFNAAGPSNVITANYIHHEMGEGILVGGAVATPTVGTIISSNLMNNSSAHGIMLWKGHTGTQIFGNQLYDHNVNIRCHELDSASETDRVVYIYRNRMWLPDVGGHFYCHFNDSSTDTYRPTFWIYNNSCSGGAGSVNVSGLAAASGGIPNFHFINNIFSDAPYLAGVAINFWTNATMVGTFNYNETTPPAITYPSASDPAWFGANNIKAAAIEWSSGSIPGFRLITGSPAIDSGVDIQISYPLLPITGETKTGPAWDMGALEYSFGNVFLSGALLRGVKL